MDINFTVGLEIVKLSNLILHQYFWLYGNFYCLQYAKATYIIMQLANYVRFKILMDQSGFLVLFKSSNTKKTSLSAFYARTTLINQASVLLNYVCTNVYTSKLKKVNLYIYIHVHLSCPMRPSAECASPHISPPTGQVTYSCHHRIMARILKTMTKLKCIF